MLKTKKTSRLSTLVMMAFVFLFSANTFAQRVVEIKGNDRMKFDVEQIDAKPGEEITIKLTTVSNLPAAAMAHNVAVLKEGVDARAFSMSSAQHKDNDYIDPAKEDEVIAHTDMAAGGKTVEVTFKVPEKAGDYEYVCTFPGHYISGMKGVLKVK